MHFGVWRGFERLILFLHHNFNPNLNNRKLLRGEKGKFRGAIVP